MSIYYDKLTVKKKLIYRVLLQLQLYNGHLKNRVLPDKQTPLDCNRVHPKADSHTKGPEFINDGQTLLYFACSFALCNALKVNHIQTQGDV